MIGNCFCPLVSATKLGYLECPIIETDAEDFNYRPLYIIQL